MKKEELQIIIGFLEKSRQKFKSANDLIKNNDFEDAISRAYYSVYHAAKALLKTKGIEPTSHDGLFRMFSLHFIKEGIFKKDFSKIFSYLQNERENGDYGLFNEFSKEDAEDAIKKAELFYKETIHYLKSSYPELLSLNKKIFQ